MAENSTAKKGSETGNEEMSFADLFEMEENSSVSKVGDVIKGTVVGIVDNHVLVDIGDKAESYIPLSEFRTDGEEEEVNVGDSFEVFVEKTGYQTTAEKIGYGTVYFARCRKILNEKTGLEQSVWNSALTSEDVAGA